MYMYMFLARTSLHLPDAVEDEEQLDEDTAKGKDTSHQGTGHWVR